MRRAVITGIGLVTALGVGREATWEALREGRSGVRAIRWPDFPDHPVRAAAWVPFPDKGSPWPERTVALAAEASREAIDDAGLCPEGLEASRFGCTLSATKGGMGALEAFACAQASPPRRMPPEAIRPYTPLIPRPSPFFWPWPISPDSAGRAAVPAGFCGPMVNIATACAAGTHSVALAAQWIADDRCDVVLCGSAEASLTPLMAAGFHAMGVLTNEPSRPFDRSRAGFAMGEGSAALIVEELRHARARRARIYAEVAGWAVGQDTYHALRSSPSGEPIARAISLALGRAGVQPEEQGYINAHGTATPSNDAAEARGIRQALGGRWEEVPVSSTKPATGHTLGASGGIEAAIASLALQEGFLPPTLNLEDVDPECELRHVQPGGERREIAWSASLSMGFGGHIGVVVLRGEPPAQVGAAAPGPSTQGRAGVPEAGEARRDPGPSSAGDSGTRHSPAGLPARRVNA